MSFENNPLKNKSKLEKQLEGNYESSDLKERISILEEEINYSKELLNTLEVEIGSAKEDKDKEELENLKNQTLLEVQSQEKKLEELLKEKISKNKEETKETGIEESSIIYAEKMISSIEKKIEEAKNKETKDKLTEMKVKIEEDLQKTKEKLEKKLKDL